MMVHEFCKKEGNCVKYIFQFARITAFCLAGEVLAAVLPLPIPASVYGLLLLAAALKFGVLKLDQVRETGLFLTGIFPLLFVPGGGGRHGAGQPADRIFYCPPCWRLCRSQHWSWRSRAWSRRNARAERSTKMAEFLQQCGSWGVLATLAAYAAGVWVNRKTGKALFNPLLMGSIFMIVFLSYFGVPYADYKSSAQPVSWLLMPATVSLAIPLYEKWELLEKNLAAIFASIAAGVLTSLGSVLAMAWLLKLERAHAVSFLPKSVTTAIGMDVAETLGGTAALAGAVIILTGIVGSLLGETVCKICRITDPLAKGLALGTSAHAIGTSKALQMGEIEGAMSGLAIAVAGIMTAILAPVAANFLP